MADVLLAYFVITAGGQVPRLGWAPVVVAVLLVTVCPAVAGVRPMGGPQTRRAVGMASAVRNLSLGLFFATPAGPVVVTWLLYGLVRYGSVPVAVRLGRSLPA